MTVDATVMLDGRRLEVSLQEEAGAWTAVLGDLELPLRAESDGEAMVVRAGHHAFIVDARTLTVDGAPTDFRLLALKGVAGAPGPGQGALGPIHPPMTGTLAEVMVEAGQEVAAGDVLFVLEAMKMRNEVKAGAAGTVVAVHRMAGEAVDPSAPILELAAG